MEWEKEERRDGWSAITRPKAMTWRARHESKRRQSKRWRWGLISLPFCVLYLTCLLPLSNMLMTTMMSKEKNMFKNSKQQTPWRNLSCLLEETLIPKHIHWSEGSHSLMFPWFNVKKEAKPRDRWNSLERVCHAFSLNFIRHRFLLSYLWQQLLSFVNSFPWMLHTEEVTVEYLLQCCPFSVDNDRSQCHDQNPCDCYSSSLCLALTWRCLFFLSPRLPFSLTWIPFLSLLILLYLCLLTTQGVRGKTRERVYYWSGCE